MRQVLVLGAGRSATSLIEYLLSKTKTEDFFLTVADFSKELAESKTGNHPMARGIGFDISKDESRSELISNADMVVSLLPPDLHLLAARECLRQKKNLVTASYVSANMQEMDHDVQSAGLLFLNECGLDPGIDHMSAMETIDGIKSKGGSINSFRSYTGGLVAPESNDNPWGYKFSWNPRNVILAGQGVAKYKEDGQLKYLPYHRLFSESRKISVEETGTFDGYANRDSLSYESIYGLEGIGTLIRGTLRQDGFCQAWNVFVRLGLTDDTYQLEGLDKATYRQLVQSFLPAGNQSVEEKLCTLCGIDRSGETFKMIEWTGILGNEPVGLKSGSPAVALQKLLESKWKLREGDKDMIVMQHEFGFSQEGKNFRETANLVVKGDDAIRTAMAKTVGLPAAISALLILNGKIDLKGVKIPVHRQIYEPVLKELKEVGITFAYRREQI